MSLLGLCTTTATVERKSTAAPSAANLGAGADTYATQYSGVPVTVQPLRGSEVTEFARRGLQADYAAYTPTALAIQTGDRLLVGTTYYHILDCQDMAGRGRAYKLVLKKKT
jgi:hypothetical protein